LAGILEKEYLNVRRLPEKPEDAPSDWEKTQIESDILLDEVNDPDDPDPREKGSEAIERRVEKIMHDLKEAGRIDDEDEKEYNNKKVRGVSDFGKHFYLR
jgi:hypothetical protein